MSRILFLFACALAIPSAVWSEDEARVAKVRLAPDSQAQKELEVGDYLVFFPQQGSSPVWLDLKCLRPGVMHIKVSHTKSETPNIVERMPDGPAEEW